MSALQWRHLWHCPGCSRQRPVTARTIFQDTHAPLTTWFRAMSWGDQSEERRLSGCNLCWASGVTGPRGHRWTNCAELWLRPGRDRLAAAVEVDETHLGGMEQGRAADREKSTVRGGRLVSNTWLLTWTSSPSGSIAAGSRSRGNRFFPTY